MSNDPLNKYEQASKLKREREDGHEAELTSGKGEKPGGSGGSSDGEEKVISIESNESGETSDDEPKARDDDANGEEEPEEDYLSQIAELETMMDAWKDKYTRLAAEFENYKRRTTTEHQSKLKFAILPFCENLLPSIDTFEKAMVLAEENPSLDEKNKEFKDGLNLIFKQIMDTFAKFGISKGNALGQDFDPITHEAMGMIEHEEFEANKVAGVFREAYMFHDRLIRPAMVQVSLGKPQNEGGKTDEANGKSNKGQ